MSMREYPSSGYTVPVASLKALLSAVKQDEFDLLLGEVEEGEKDGEDLAEFLGKALSEKFPAFEIYRVSDEDTPDEDNMECGGYYVVFDESDLYVKTETPEHTTMKKLGIVPTFSRWSVWG